MYNTKLKKTYYFCFSLKVKYCTCHKDRLLCNFLKLLLFLYFTVLSDIFFSQCVPALQ